MEIFDSVLKLAAVVLSFSGIVLLAIRSNKQYLDSKFNEMNEKFDKVNEKFDEASKDRNKIRITVAEVKVKVDRLWSA